MEYAIVAAIAFIAWAIGVRMGANYAVKRIREEFDL